MKLQPNAMNIWQLKLMFLQVLTTTLCCNLVQSEVILAIKEQIIEILEHWEPHLRPGLQAYLNGSELVSDKDTLTKLAMYVIFYDIPFRENVERNPLEVLLRFQDKFSINTLEKIVKLGV